MTFTGIIGVLGRGKQSIWPSVYIIKYTQRRPYKLRLTLIKIVNSKAQKLKTHFFTSLPFKVYDRLQI